MKRKHIFFTTLIVATLALIASAVTAVQAEFKPGLGGHAQASIGTIAMELATSPVPTVTLDPSATPIPSATFDPSATPVPSTTPGTEKKIEISGTITAITGNMWTINGKIVMVTDATKVKGNPVVGDMVSIEVQVQADGSLLAHEVEKESSSGMGDDSEVIKTPENEDDHQPNATVQATREADEHHDGDHTSITSTPDPSDDEEHSGATSTPEVHGNDDAHGGASTPEPKREHD